MIWKFGASAAERTNQPETIPHYTSLFTYNLYTPLKNSGTSKFNPQINLPSLINCNNSHIHRLQSSVFAFLYLYSYIRDIVTRSVVENLARKGVWRSLTMLYNRPDLLETDLQMFLFLAKNQINRPSTSRNAFLLSQY